jgi:nodulation protein F
MPIRIGDITPETELTALGIHSPIDRDHLRSRRAYGIEIELNTVDAWNNLKNVGDMVAAVRTLIDKKNPA